MSTSTYFSTMLMLLLYGPPSWSGSPGIRKVSTCVTPHHSKHSTPCPLTWIGKIQKDKIQVFPLSLRYTVFRMLVIRWYYDDDDVCDEDKDGRIFNCNHHVHTACASCERDEFHAYVHASGPCVLVSVCVWDKARICRGNACSVKKFKFLLWHRHHAGISALTWIPQS